MAHREWGWLCPDGHGLLLTKEGWSNVLCPHSDHGGNGRFYQTSEVKEGWWDDKHPVITETTIERQARATEAGREVREVEQTKERERAMAKAATATKERTTKAAPEPRACACGCEGLTKGGRFLPGHDARFHARVKTLTGTFGLDHDQAEKIAGKGPLTGKYAVKPKAPKAEAAPAEEAPAEEVAETISV